MERGLDLSELIVDCTLQALCNVGILTELDGQVGYNGITTPKGVSSEFLADTISDIFNSQFEELAKGVADSIAQEAFNDRQ